MRGGRILWGSDRRRLHHRSGDDLGGDAMDRMASRLSGAAWQSMVRAGGPADLLPAGLLLVVVFLRRLCARDLRRGRHHRGIGRLPRHRRRNLHVDHPGAGGAQRRHLWIGTMGRGQGNPHGRIARPDGVVLGRYDRDYLRHDGPEHVLCFAPTRSGKGVGLVVPTLLTWPGSCIVHDIKGENWTLTAGFRAKHGRVLLFDPTNAKSSAYNPAAGGAAGRMGSPRRAEHRGYSGRSRRQSRQAQPLGKDQPFAAGRRDPACPLCREGQDAGRRRQLPVRSAPPGRGDLARDDGHAASRRGRRSSRHRVVGPRAAEQERERAQRRVVHRHVVPRPLPRSRRGRASRRAATGALPIWSAAASPSASTLSCRRPTSTAPSRSSA